MFQFAGHQKAISGTYMFLMPYQKSITLINNQISGSFLLKKCIRGLNLLNTLIFKHIQSW